MVEQTGKSSARYLRNLASTAKMNTLRRGELLALPPLAAQSIPALGKRSNPAFDDDSGSVASTVRARGVRVRCVCACICACESVRACDCVRMRACLRVCATCNTCQAARASLHAARAGLAAAGAHGPLRDPGRRARPPPGFP